MRNHPRPFRVSVAFPIAMIVAVLVAGSMLADKAQPGTHTSRIGPCSAVAPYFATYERLERLRDILQVDPGERIDILDFDHLNLRWSGCIWSPSRKAQALAKDRKKAKDALDGSTQDAERAKAQKALDAANASLKALGPDKFGHLDRVSTNELQTGPDGSPKLRRDSGDQFLLAVSNTNPFLYSRDTTILPPVDTAVIANLKTLGGTAGGLLSAALPVLLDKSNTAANIANMRVQVGVQSFEVNSEGLGVSPPPPPLVVTALKERQRALERLNADLAEFYAIKDTRQIKKSDVKALLDEITEVTQPIGPSFSEIKIGPAKAAVTAIDTRITEAFAPTVQALTLRLDYLQAQETLVRLPELQANTALFVQKLEYSNRLQVDSVSPPDFQPSEVDNAAGDVFHALDFLRSEHQRLVQTVRGCLPEWAAVTALLNREKLTATDVSGARTDFYKAGASTPSACQDSRPRDIYEALFATAPPPKSGSAVAADVARTSETSRLAARTGAYQKGKGLGELQADFLGNQDVKDAILLLKINELLAQQKAIEAALAQLSSFVRTAERVAIAVNADGSGWDKGGDEILLVRGVALLNPSIEAQKWDKEYGGTLSIKPDASLCADCGTVRATVDKKGYTLTSRAESWLGVGFGVTYTSLKDPTYGKVSLDPTGATTKQLVIGRTAETSRAGMLAVLGIIRLLPLLNPDHRRGPWFEPGVEFGAGLDAKAPAGFLGFSFEFQKVLRLGVGGTLQSITTLSSGLREASYGPDGLPIPGTGSNVASDGDVRTTKRTTTHLYVSLVIGVDSLPIFGPNK